LSLERIDFRDNKLTDPTEVARLTVVPEIREIYVHRNLFCKTHTNYRVTIFNIFRKTPGYTEDIIVDSTGPSSSEKRQLVDRAPELVGVPVMRAPPEDDVPPPFAPPKVVKAIDGTLDTVESPKRNSPYRTKSVKAGQTGSQRRKKGPKRRIVELSQSEIAQQASDCKVASLFSSEYSSSPAITPPVSKPSPEVISETVPHFEEPLKENSSGDPAKRPISHERASTQPLPVGPQQLTPIDTALSPQQTPQQITNPPEFDVSSDLYKKKIESLRQDFGNTWLSALGEENWDTTSVKSFPSERGYTSPSIRPTLPRTPSQGIVSGGRTLG
jgi:hypothetical protein